MHRFVFHELSFCLHLCQSRLIVSLQDVGKGGVLHSAHCFYSRLVFLFPFEAGNRKPQGGIPIALIFVLQKCATLKRLHICMHVVLNM